MSTTSSNPTNRDWLRKLIAGQPHQVIPNRFGGPYLRRWYLIPRNSCVNVYLHHFLSSDDDRALHDHPWWFLSLILRGSYDEITEGGTRRRRTGSVAFRRAEHRHRVELPTTPGLGAAWNGPELPCWTLIVTGRRSRAWGFWCKDRFGETRSRRYVVERFVPWQQFEAVGGCGETA